jgi:hypothetical protein
MQLQALLQIMALTLQIGHLKVVLLPIQKIYTLTVKLDMDLI